LPFYFCLEPLCTFASLRLCVENLLVSFYPKQISEYFSSPRNTGRAKFANAVGTNATFVCGSALRWTLRIEDRKIVEAKFQTNGCGFMMAAADVLAEIIVEKSLTELHGLEDFDEQIQNKLCEFPENRRHCLELVIETLQAAFNDFRSAQLEEWSGEKALICTCFGVSEETIERIIAENQFETVEEVSRKCNAGSGCGSCQPLIQEIIDSFINLGSR
jgi:NifU-like protein